MTQDNKKGGSSKEEMALALASIPLKTFDLSGAVLIGIKGGYYASLINLGNRVYDENLNIGFKVLLGLISSMDALNEEEKETITKIATNVLKRKNDAHEAARNPSGEEAAHG